MDAASHLRDHVPFREHLLCTFKQASQVSGLGRSKLYLMVAKGALESVHVGKRHLIKVPSLLRLLGEE